MVFAYDNQFTFLVISSTFFRVHAYRVNVKFSQLITISLSPAHYATYHLLLLAIKAFLVAIKLLYMRLCPSVARIDGLQGATYAGFLGGGGFNIERSRMKVFLFPQRPSSTWP